MDKTIIAGIALIFSIVSLAWQYFTWGKQHKQARLTGNLSLLANLKMQLAKMPEAYRFHGITEEMLKEHSITEKELAYLVSNFISGQIYYEAVNNDPSQPFDEGDYRAIMCKTEAVRKAWPLVRQMLDDTSYRTKVDITIEKYNS